MSSERFLEAKKNLSGYSRDEVESMAVNWMILAQDSDSKMSDVVMIMPHCDPPLDEGIRQAVECKNPCDADGCAIAAEGKCHWWQGCPACYHTCGGGLG